MKLYKFYKPGCSPCNTLGKVLKLIDLSSYELIEVDMSCPFNKEKYPEIDSVPRLRLENGEELVGVRSKVNTEKWLVEYGRN